MATTPKCRWGIVGTGAMATDFVRALRISPGAVVAAVGSRSAATAAAFGDKLGIPERHSSYEALAGDPGVDVVYIATPNSTHAQLCKLFLAAGKHVLCEKPFATTAKEAQDVVDTLAACRRRGGPKPGVVVEAMWMRWQPSTAKAVSLVADLGGLTAAHAEIGFEFDDDDWDGNFGKPAMGGGSLLDIGVYPVSLASMLCGGGPPSSVTATGTLAATGVDSSCRAVLRYGAVECVAECTALKDAANTATLTCKAGVVTLEAPFWASEHVSVSYADGTPAATFSFPRPPPGSDAEETFPNSRALVHEVAALQALVEAGGEESPLMPLAETVQVMQTLDTIRAQVGVVFPSDVE